MLSSLLYHPKSRDALMQRAGVGSANTPSWSPAHVQGVRDAVVEAARNSQMQVEQDMAQRTANAPNPMAPTTQPDRSMMPTQNQALLQAFAQGK